MTTSRDVYVSPEGIEFKRPKYWVTRQQNRAQSTGKLNTIGGGEFVEYELELSTLPDGTPNFNVDRDNDGTVDGFLSNNIYIPANASIKSVEIFTREAAVGGTSVDVGIFQFDGTAVDAAGLATFAVADVDQIGKRVVGAGTLTVPATSSVGADPVTIGLTGTGDFTAGRVQIMVEYSLNTQ